MWVVLLTYCVLGLGARGEYQVQRGLEAHDLIQAPFSSLPSPADLVKELTEEEYEDYLDLWLYRRERESIAESLIKNIKDRSETGTCSVLVSSLNYSSPQPVYVRMPGSSLLLPSEGSGALQLTSWEPLLATCKGEGNSLILLNSSLTPGGNYLAEANVVCVAGTAFVSPNWQWNLLEFSDIGCKYHSPPAEGREEGGNGTCVGGVGTLLTIGLAAGDTLHPLIRSCFHEARAEVLYVTYTQTPDNTPFMLGGDRPLFAQGEWFPGLDVNTLYSQNSQKVSLDQQLGAGMAAKYLNSTNFFTRGHLAARTDFVLTPAQRATFSFINAAPQWQLFNGGNWNTLEQDLRIRIASSKANTQIYTGTWGVLRLADSNGVPKDLYLSTNTNQIPIPLWFYKVVHEPSTNKATVFLGLNNPHVTLSEARSLAFCTDRCRGNSFHWLSWSPEDLDLGYSICCDVNDFRKTVNHLPGFTSTSLFSSGNTLHSCFKLFLIICISIMYFLQFILI